MNSKMTNNYQQLNLRNKNKLSKQVEQEQNHRNVILFTWWVISGTGLEENGGKGMGNKKHKWQVQNKQGEVKNSIGNGEAKELVCRAHGHELKGWECWWEGCSEWRELRGEKKGTTVMT